MYVYRDTYIEYTSEEKDSTEILYKRLFSPFLCPLYSFCYLITRTLPMHKFKTCHYFSLTFSR